MIFDKGLPQDETHLTDLFNELKEHGRVLLIVDQPNTIGALPVAVARANGSACSPAKSCNAHSCSTC